MRESYIKDTTASRIFDVFNIMLMLLLIFIMVYPFWNQLVVSLNEGADGQKGGLYWWPRVFTLQNYIYILSSKNLLRAVGVSVLRVVVGTVTCLFFSGLVAYITTIKWFSAHRVLRVVFVLSMYFSGGLIPTYLWFMKLGLLETFSVYWIPGLINAYYMMLIASYISGLPDSLAESARLDGANETKIYIRIILPMCLPVMAALAIMCAVGHWNSWFDVMIYNPSGKWNTLQMLLRDILIKSEKLQELMKDATSGSGQVKAMAQRITTNSMRAATTMVVTLPIVFVYPYFQKYFIKGISVGAVKG